MNHLQSAFFRNCIEAEKHVDDVHRIGPVLEVHVHPVELVSLSLPGFSGTPSFSKLQ